MEPRNEEELDGDVLAALSKIPPRHKVNSYSQQIGGSGSGNGNGMIKRNQIRKHSLDEGRIPKNIERYYDSSDDETYPNHSIHSTSAAASTNFLSSLSRGSGSGIERNDYMNQFLEMKQPNDGSGDVAERRPDNRPLPEFIANGGGKGVFKVPVRAPEHPGRPPALELRPHPLRETQIGSFIRAIACTENQLWAGQECGVRFWNFTDIYEPGCGTEGLVKKGDEDAAPFYQSTQTPPTNCFIVDEANKLVWSGHKDGKIRSWKMDQTVDGTSFKEGLSWNAHRGPVLSMIMDSYGDLWSGSEGGILRIWPWETIAKSLSLSAAERHMAALLVERSYLDLRSKVTVNGVCLISASDVKYLLSDYSRGKVWSAGQLSFALWDARTRELLKVFNIDGQIENRADMSGHDIPIEEEIKVKLVSSSKKEKSQGSLSFFQRSRNALMGAADAVRRVAAKGGLVEDNKRTEALVMTMDGMIWTGCSNGYLVQWDGNGNRLQDLNHHHFAVQCLCTFGERLWVGYASGTVQVLDLDGNLIGGWVAHSCPVIRMTFGAGYVFTLANHGGIRGWNMESPCPLDNILRSELASKEVVHMKLENLKILVGTWNVGQGRASLDALRLWLGSAASEVGIVVVGLQEVEMGAGFLAMSAARETVGLEGSSIGLWWMDAIGRALDEGTTFDRVGSRQLAGLLIAVWVRSTLRPQVGDIDAAAVPCGFGRAIGNKGGVGVRMRVYDRKICFVNCHLAAHLEAVTRRNQDFDHIFKNMIFNRPTNLLNAAASGVSSAVQMLRGANVALGIHCEDGKPELSEADMVVFLGDFNYRLHGISYDEAREFVSQRCFDWLRERDQLRAEMKAGRVFQGMREGLILFPPTYKFERHIPGLGGYDSGEKKRIPAWCDRVIYRDNRDNHPAAVYECNLSCPVISSILLYEAVMDVTDSDHKPVRCMYKVDVAHVNESLRRQEFGEIIQSNEKVKSLIKKSQDVPEIACSSENIFLQNQNKFLLQITNHSEDAATFEIYCEGQSIIKEDGQGSEHCPRGSFGFPRWLEVTPAVGVLLSGKSTDISIQLKDSHALHDSSDGSPQNWWSEDSKNKEAMLILRSRGSCSTSTSAQRILVHHSSSKATNNDTANDSPLE